MASKCFCHLNGYEVKDATARNSIENLELTVANNKAACEQTATTANEAKDNAASAASAASAAQTTANEAKSAANSAASAASAAQTTANEAKTNAATNANNLSALEERVAALENTETEYVTEMALAYDSSTESLTIGTEVKTYE